MRRGHLVGERIPHSPARLPAAPVSVPAPELRAALKPALGHAFGRIDVLPVRPTPAPRHTLQRYPKGPGKLIPMMEGRVDRAVAKMLTSSLDYEVAAANDIQTGGIDVAYPDFMDTTVSPPQVLETTSALNRLRSWELGTTPDPQVKALVPATGREIPFKKGQEAETLHHQDYDGVIYLLALISASRLPSILLHEALHLTHPLGIKPGEPGAEREKFISELRSYYYSDYRNVGDEVLRFTRAATDANKDTGYLTGEGITIEQAVINRVMWMAEVGAP